MEIDVNGTRLWFDIDGATAVPDDASMRSRPTLLLVHGGPGSYDHSYFEPFFWTFRDVAHVVAVDLRDHGRSARHDPADWSFELCADDLAAFCTTLGIHRPVVLGHSMGGCIAMLLAIRHPDVPGSLILLSTLARFDLETLVEGFRRNGGDEVAELARRDYRGDAISASEWDRVFAAFGPTVLDRDALMRRIRNPDVNGPGMDRLRALDLTVELPSVRCPTLIVTGERDGPTPVEMAEEIAAGLRPGIGQLVTLPDAGHFPWLDRPEAVRDLVDAVLRDHSGSPG